MVPAFAVLNTINPVAGVNTGDAALLADKATRGIKRPWVEELTSSFADTSGEEVPIPILDCAKEVSNNNTMDRDSNNLFIATYF